MRKRMRKLRMDLPESSVDIMNDLADREGVLPSEILRRALSILIAYDRQIAKGRTHLGFTSDPGHLDAEIVGILKAPVHHRLMAR